MRITDVLLSKKISGGGGVDPSQGATATAADITLGKTAAADGEMLTGTLEPPDLGSKTITANGTYAASADNLDGYSEVSVNVVQPISFEDFDNDGYPTVLRVSLKNIPDSMFYTTNKEVKYYKSVTKLIISEGVETIGGWAFRTNSTGYCAISAPVNDPLVFPSTLRDIYDSFRGVTGIKKMIFNSELAFGQDSFFGMQTYLQQIVFNRQITAWNGLPFGNGAGNADGTPKDGCAIELYDFSGCDTIFALGRVDALPHSDGCVIKVKSSLLEDWQDETNWVQQSGVVWQGV